MQSVNYLAILVASLSVFFLGGIWYSHNVFGKIWGHEAHMNQKKEGHPKRVYAISLLFSLISATAFAYFLGAEASFEKSMELAVLVGVCWVASSFGINYLFAGRSWKMLLIDAGYHAFQFLIYGIIFGLWH